jgi:hypothetical protein
MGATTVEAPVATRDSVEMAEERVVGTTVVDPPCEKETFSVGFLRDIFGLTGATQDPFEHVKPAPQQFDPQHVSP